MGLIGGRKGWFESGSVVFLLFSALACSRPEKIGIETPAEYDLPQEGSTVDLNNFAKFVNSNKPGPLHKHNRDALTCKKCVEVEIQSIGLTTDIDEKKGPAKARVIARIQNNSGKDAAAMYGIKTKDKADYYLWVDGKGSNNAARWTVVELNKLSAGKARVHHGESGLFTLCANDSTKVSDADFKSCASAHPAATLNKSSLGAEGWLGLIRSSMTKLFQLGDSLVIQEDPAWIRCANGCCTAANS